MVNGQCWINRLCGWAPWSSILDFRTQRILGWGGRRRFETRPGRPREAVQSHCAIPLGLWVAACSWAVVQSRASRLAGMVLHCAPHSTRDAPGRGEGKNLRPVREIP